MERIQNRLDLILEGCSPLRDGLEMRELVGQMVGEGLGIELGVSDGTDRAIIELESRLQQGLTRQAVDSGRILGEIGRHGLGRRARPSERLSLKR
jgi:hypothetical protein